MRKASLRAIVPGTGNGQNRPWHRQYARQPRHGRRSALGAARLTSRMPTMIVKADRANIRSGPGTRYRIVVQAEYGDLLKTKERRGRWVNVTLSHKRKSGWVARALVCGAGSRSIRWRAEWEMPLNFTSFGCH